MIKYIKSVLWRSGKRLSYTEVARCLKVKIKAQKQNIINIKPVFNFLLTVGGLLITVVKDDTYAFICILYMHLTRIYHECYVWQRFLSVSWAGRTWLRRRTEAICCYQLQYNSI